MADDPYDIEQELAFRSFFDPQFKPKIQFAPKDRCMKTVTRQGNQITIDIIIPEVVNWVMKSLPVVTIVEMDEIYWYYDGRYIPKGDKFIGKILQQAFGSLTNDKDKPVLTKAKIEEIIGGIKRSTYREKVIFESDEPLLNIANGVLNLETMKMLPHTPDNHFLTKSSINYYSDAECPAFKEWIDDVLAKKHQDTLQEIFGYTLWPDYRAHKAFMLYGPPRAGKGLTLRILEELHGKENCAHVSLQTIATNRFSTAQLYGKRINTFGDLPSAPISDTGIIKGLCGEDSFTVENKFGQPFTMYNRANPSTSAVMAGRASKTSVPGSGGQPWGHAQTLCLKEHSVWANLLTTLTNVRPSESFRGQENPQA